MRMMLVLLALILHSVSAAAADCAILLWAEDSWMQSGGEKAGSTVKWTLLQTESSLAQCEANSRAKLESLAEGYRKNTQADKVEVLGNILSVQVVRGDLFSYGSLRYLCVPDSIDPRPKAYR